MIPQKTIEELINKHSILENDLSSGKIDKKLFAEKSKEYSDLNDIILIGRKIRGSKAYKSYVEERGNVQLIKSYSANYIHNF